MMYGYASPFQRYGYGYPSHSYDDDYAPRDYYQALAQQRAREQLEAQYRAQLEEAHRRRAYEEEIARAQARRDAEAEAARRRYTYDPFLSGFDYGDDDAESYSSFLNPGRYPTRRTNGRASAGRDRGGHSPRQDFLEDLIEQQMAARDEGHGIKTRRLQMNTGPHLESPKGDPSKNSHIPSGNHMHKRAASPSKKVHIGSEDRKAQTPHSPPRSPSPNTVLRTNAARKIQEFIRMQLPRLSAFKAIKKISDQFDDIRLSFQFPDILDFADVKPDSDSVPDLLYTHRNAPVHGHEHALIKLLSKLDEVDSLGDGRIRRVRKQLVKRIEEELSDLDTKKITVWKKMRSETSLGTEGLATEASVPAPVKDIDSGYGSEGSTGAAEPALMDSGNSTLESVPEAKASGDTEEMKLAQNAEELEIPEVHMDDEPQTPESQNTSETLRGDISSEESDTPTLGTKADNKRTLESEPTHAD